MATLQKFKNKEKLLTTSNNLMRLIPTSIENHSKSAHFVKELMGVAISSILYYRQIFDDSYFSSRRFDSIDIKILKSNTDNPKANRIAEIVFSAHEAVDKGYLRQFIIIIKNNGKAIEKHTFTFEYSDKHYKKMILEHITENKRNEKKLVIEEICSQSKNMIYSIVLMMRQISVLPIEPEIFMKLTYYDEVTPTDYQPKYFQPTTDQLDDFIDGKSKVLGLVTTPFHSLNLKTKIGKNMTGKDDMKAASETIVPTSLEVERNSLSQYNITELTDTVSMTGCLSQPPLKEPEVDEAQEILSDISGYSKIICPCGSKIEYGLMIRCDNCKMLQHGFCFAIIEESHTPNPHICDICALKYKGIKATAPELTNMPLVEKSSYCIKLFAMGLCFKTDSFITINTFSDILGISLESAQTLIDYFLANKILLKKSKGIFVNKRVFKKSIIPKYFINRNQELDGVV